MGTEKKRLGIKTELIAIAAIPSIIIALVVIILAGSSLSEGLDNKELAGLTHLAEAVNAGYNVIEGNYRVDDAGTLWKGDTNLTQEIDLIDSFVGDSDAEVTLFIDKTRRLTTLVDNSSGERIVEQMPMMRFGIS